MLIEYLESPWLKTGIWMVIRLITLNNTSKLGLTFLNFQNFSSRASKLNFFEISYKILESPCGKTGVCIIIWWIALNPSSKLSKLWKFLEKISQSDGRHLTNYLVMLGFKFLVLILVVPNCMGLKMIFETKFGKFKGKNFLTLAPWISLQQFIRWAWNMSLPIPGHGI